MADCEASRFPRKEFVHMPGSLTTQGPARVLAIAHANVLPSDTETPSAPWI
jgi:hypothetical protein